MSDEQHDALMFISQERNRQDKKWGGHREQDGLLWSTILTEEVGEVSKALLDRAPSAELQAELIQVAAVAVAWIEALMAERGGLRQ